MGKTELEQALDEVPASPEPPLENAARRCPPCRSVGRIVSLRCVSALLFGVAVLLSAVFWLPPFFRRGFGGGVTDLDKQYGGEAVWRLGVLRIWSYLGAWDGKGYGGHILCIRGS